MPTAHFDHTVEEARMDVPEPLAERGSPSEWILIFATWFARRQPDLSAEEVLAQAIREFKVSASVAPEQAAARCCCR